MLQSIHRVKIYFSNLGTALQGKNPYRKELESVKIEYNTIVDKVGELQEKALWFDQQMQALEKSVSAYQNLTENLRQRIAEKDAQMKEMATNYAEAVNTLRQQHKMQLGEWETKNAELRDDLDSTLDQLQRVKKDIGKEMMSANILAKTNASLNDLSTAMESEDIEMMMQAVEYLSWSSPITRIAQRHLIVLRRKNELEERAVPKNSMEQTR